MIGTFWAEEISATEIGQRVKFTAKSGAEVEDILTAIYVDTKGDGDARIWFSLKTVIPRHLSDPFTSVAAFEVQWGASVKVTEE